jgi:hypothetical protein
MVAFTSADYLRLQGAGGDGIFYANSGANSVLTSAPVAAYGFLGSNPGAITVQGSQFSVTPGQSISLVGGNITVQSGTLDNGTVQPALLSAPGGQINLASVASPGEILAQTMNQAPNMNGQSFGALGTIQVLEQSHIDASGNGGGTVLIRGGQFLLDNSTISANITGPGPVVNGAESIGGGINIQVSQNAVIQNGGVLETNILGDVTADVTYGGVQIKANQIEIAGVTTPPFPFTGIRSDVGTDTQPSITGGNSGSISLEAHSILINGGGTLETRVIGSDPVTPVPGNAGNITVTADHDIQLNNSSIVSTLFFGAGSAGDITLTSRHGNIIETGTLPPPNFIPTPDVPFPDIIPNIIFNQTIGGPGKSGNVSLNALEGNIQLAGALIVLGVPPGGSGIAAGFKANAKSMNLINFSTVQVDNFSTQPASNFDLAITGNLTVDSSRVITTARGPAQAASLNITAHDILVTQGGSLSTETQDVGNAGHLNISADTLQLTSGGQITSGSTQAPAPPPFLGLPPPPPPTGAGGTITVRGFAGSGSSASSVIVDGAGSGIFTNTVGTGAAGNTNIATQSLSIQNGGTISAATSGTASSATGGSVNINVTNGVTMTNGGSITASSTGPANAGNIFVNAGPQLVMQNSSIKTEAAQAGGGNIEIQAGNLVQLGNSTVSTSVLGGSGSGGNITIDPNSVILQNSQILAQAVQGSGGNISITTNLLLPDSASIISASSQFGQQGNIVIQSPVSPASGKIVPLGQKPLLPTSLLSQRCAALAGGNISSFTVAGRDALPAEPGGWVSSPLVLSMSEDGTVGETGLSTSPSEPAEDIPLLSLRKIAPPGFLTQSFAASSDCTTDG